VGGGLGLIVVVILSLLLGENPLNYINSSQSFSQSTDQAAPLPDDDASSFVSVVLKDTEDVWSQLFEQQLNADYQKPSLVLFTQLIDSDCGTSSSSTGPFYCPADGKVYIDLAFYDDLKNQLNAPGDFAMAYVIAHEVGHHVQNLLGISDKVRNAQRNASDEESNALSVKLELQADFFAGVWAHHAQQLSNILEDGDLEEALNAANAIGDDRLQMRGQGYVVPDAFTHGTSAQRVYWFKKGFETGDLNAGNTFEEIE
jgi:hypothetical protein